LGDPKAAVDLLIQTDRPAEAALLARTYVPRFASIPFATFSEKESNES
jgi:hypothetical protein